MSVFVPVVRLEGAHPVAPPHLEETVRYALLIYSNTELRDRTTEEDRRRIDAGVAAVLERPNIVSWLRLHDPGSATTVGSQGSVLLTDGPFIDSKDFLGGIIEVEAESLDGAITLADELQELRGLMGAIEIRPVRAEPLVGA